MFVYNKLQGLPKIFHLVKQRKLIFILIAFLGVTLISFTLLNYVPSIVTSRLATPPPIQEAQSILLKRSTKGLEITTSLMEDLLEHGAAKPFERLNSGLRKELNDKGLAIFLFCDNDLVFWSDNIDVKTLREESARLVFVQNVWCISYWLSGENLKGLLLVKVKYDFPYQNQFLKNQYHSSLSFLEDFKISPIALRGAFPIVLIGSQPVFYLSHIPQLFDDECDKLSAKLSWTSYLFFFATIYTLFWLPFFRRRGFFSSLILVVVSFAIRLLALHYQWLPNGNWTIFNPEIFAFSWIYPSLGDFFINAVIVFLLTIYVYRNVSFGIKKRKPLANALLVITLGTLNFLLFFYIDQLFSILISNSTIVFETYKIFNLTFYSALGYLAISLWFATSLLVLHGTMNQLIRVNRFAVRWFLVLALFTALAILVFLDRIPSYYGIGASVALAFIVVRFFGRTRELPSSFILFVVLVLSLYSVLLVSDLAGSKDRSIRQVYAINLSNERDPIAEFLFPSIAKRLHADNEIKEFLEDIANNEQNLYNHLNDYYLGGYFKKYDFQITVCLPTSDLIIEKTDEKVRCYDFFEEMLNEYGFRIPGSSFFHLSNQNGRISYLGMIEYVLADGNEICIYLELDTKLSRELLGYPELLLEGKLAGKSSLAEYSSAKYSNNQLIARTGSFNYPLINQFPSDTASRYTFYNDNGFNHLVYNSEGGVVIVLSRPNVSLFNVTASFAWVFLFFYITLLLLSKLGQMPIDLRSSVPSFRNRIQRAMVQVLFLSLILVGIVTTIYNVNSFQRKNHQNLLEKLSSAMVEIERNLVNEDLLHPQFSDYITYYLVHLSNVFYSDINLYDSTGNLLASSRPEIFDRKLLGFKMNPLAWNQMAVNHQARLIYTEKIGSMSYLSAYVPLYNLRNERVAYLNLPYFTRQSEFIREVFAIIVALVNLYALLILFTIFVAIIISSQITRPLELIREKLRKIDITKHNEPINYESDDEVGRLVKEYNRMILELADSAEKLAHSQRQSAWREMAKQIAHEIKNPLTPMKLSLQHLVKAKNENQPHWEQLFDRFAATLIDQINSLSNIATEFSNFAKMPASNIETFNLRKVLNDATNLFSSYPNIELTTKDDTLGDILVKADKEQIHRVFVNLLKNAVQSISRNKIGVITVSIEGNDKMVTVIIEDNGSGIEPNVQGKLFSPNFTTKSGGMGLGLSIAKGIVQSVDGDIWFETQPNEGSKFFVQLPRV